MTTTTREALPVSVRSRRSVFVFAARDIGRPLSFVLLVVVVVVVSVALSFHSLLVPSSFLFHFVFVDHRYYRIEDQLNPLGVKSANEHTRISVLVVDINSQKQTRNIT